MASAVHFEVLRSAPQEVIDDAMNAARNSRRMRGLGTRNPRALNEEAESIRRVVAALYEYCVVNRVALCYKRLTAECNDCDAVEEECSEDAVAEGFEKFWYALNVELRVNGQSYGGVVKNCGQMGSELDVEVKRALDTLDTKRNAVSLDRDVKVTYNSRPDDVFYSITVVLATPAMMDRPYRSPPNKKFAKLVASNNVKNRIEKRKAEEPEKSALAPSVEECVDFYSKHASTWKFLGAGDVSGLILADEEHAPNKRARTY